MVHHKISFCTVCMNRAMHIKNTLLKNIKDNADYPDVEFILLDYNSGDDLYTWAKSELQPYIDNGILTYYRTTDPLYFHMSHSKNMALRLATGDILCSLDADNYTGVGFATYINKQFSKDRNIFLAPPFIGREKRWWDVQGRVCLAQDDFYHFRGYDEQVMDYGYDDKDLKSRMEKSGKKRITIKDTRFLNAIKHDDQLRIADGFSTKKTKELFISAVGNETSEIIYLQDNDAFERFFINNEDELRPRKMYTGKYQLEAAGIKLLKTNGKGFMNLTQHTDDHLVSNDNRNFYRVTSGSLREVFLLERAIYMGKKIYFHNRKNRHAININGFGQGKVYKNFSEEEIILH
ncbi:glycosyltransferase [Chitinophaga oryziterrae]|uniref:Glycosyltransferase n=1 Tax=Chitinophaga oryziterrae TaxID=1031224 RepID=A0A6N8JET8_9BACT|nr:glycosyltransferase family A protein [Chitinophaga oryziterrae]MVT42819.1 glycosyltransferase [Chitinophaga oryziterrae]